MSLTWWYILYRASAHIHLSCVYSVVLYKEHFTCRKSLVNVKKVEFLLVIHLTIFLQWSKYNLFDSHRKPWLILRSFGVTVNTIQRTIIIT